MLYTVLNRPFLIDLFSYLQIFRQYLWQLAHFTLTLQINAAASISGDVSPPPIDDVFFHCFRY